jgi:hypothetical protein
MVVKFSPFSNPKLEFEKPNSEAENINLLPFLGRFTVDIPLIILNRMQR